MGSHPTYTKGIAEQMDALLDYGKNNNWTKTDYKNAVNELIKNERAGLRNGTTKLNKKSVRASGC